MSRTEENSLIRRIFANLVNGDEAGAKELAKRLDMNALARLREAGQNVAVLAENEYFSKGREKRPWKL